MTIARFLLIFLIFTSLWACKKESTTPEPSPENGYLSGVLVSNEGPFQTGSGTITFYDREKREATTDLFELVNGRPLGNIVQSVQAWQDRYYLVVNNASKVEVVEAKTFKSAGVIQGLVSPRYFLGISPGKAYVSDWADNVAVVDLGSLSVLKTIPTGTGPESMVRIDNKVFAANSGGWTLDSTITVIDAIGDSVLATLFVAHNPAALQTDKNGKLWVLCRGRGWNGFPAPDDTPGHLVCIDPQTFTIAKDFEIPLNLGHPDKLIINSDKTMLYYILYGKVYNFSIEASALNGMPFLATARSFYSIGFDPATSLICGADALDFVQNGWIFRYRSLDGALQDSFKAGVIPGNFCFR